MTRLRRSRLAGALVALGMLFYPRTAAGLLFQRVVRVDFSISATSLADLAASFRHNGQVGRSSPRHPSAFRGSERKLIFDSISQMTNCLSGRWSPGVRERILHADRWFFLLSIFALAGRVQFYHPSAGHPLPGPPSSLRSRRNRRVFSDGVRSSGLQRCAVPIRSGGLDRSKKNSKIFSRRKGSTTATRDDFVFLWASIKALCRCRRLRPGGTGEQSRFSIDDRAALPVVARSMGAPARSSFRRGREAGRVRSALQFVERRRSGVSRRARSLSGKGGGGEPTSTAAKTMQAIVPNDVSDSSTANGTIPGLATSISFPDPLDQRVRALPYTMTDRQLAGLPAASERGSILLLRGPGIGANRPRLQIYRRVMTPSMTPVQLRRGLSATTTLRSFRSEVLARELRRRRFFQGQGHRRRRLGAGDARRRRYRRSARVVPARSFISKQWRRRWRTSSCA